MDDIVYPETGPRPSHIPTGYRVDPNNPWKLIWRYPACEFRKLKERICCHGLKQKIQYCLILKYRVYNECIGCDKRKP